MKNILVLSAVMVASSLIAGCNWELSEGNSWEQGSGNYQVYIDPNFVPAQQALAKQAIDKWTSMLIGSGSPVSFQFTDDWRQGSDLITISPSTVEEVTTEEDQAGVEGDELLGLTTHYGTASLLQISIEETDVRFLQIVQHETGHALGLVHHTSGVMCKDAHCASLEVQCTDVYQLCGIWDCDANELSGCKNSKYFQPN